MLPVTRVLTVAITLVLGAAVQAEEAAPARDPKLGSYQIGLLLGSQLRHSGAAKEILGDELVRGLRESLAGREISNSERDAAQAYLKGTREVLANENRVLARNFLAANAKQIGRAHV